MINIKGPGPRMPMPLSCHPVPNDPESERLRECLRILGPAMDEEGFAVRRHIAGCICMCALRPYQHEALLCDPTSGDLAAETKHHLTSVCQSALDSSEFSPDILFERTGAKITIDIQPRYWPGPPWMVEQRKAAERKILAEIEQREPVTFEGQNE